MGFCNHRLPHDCPTILAMVAMASFWAEAVLLVLECIVRFSLSGAKQFFCGPEPWPRPKQKIRFLVAVDGDAMGFATYMFYNLVYNLYYII